MSKKLLLSMVLLSGCSLMTQTDSTALDQQKIQSTSNTKSERTQSMQQKIQQTQWQLVSYLSAGNMQQALPDNPATLLFSRRKVSGSTGCNQYFSAYQLTGQQGLKFTQSGSTKMACPEEKAQQEQQYFINLAEIEKYQLLSGQLQLTDAQQQVRLIFKPMPAVTLQNTSWQMTGINNGRGGVVSTAYTGQAYLQFTEGKLQGNSGCNDFVATYTQSANALTIAPAISTRKICQEDELMLQEQLILHALKKVTRYEIRLNQLRLLNKKGSLMLSLKQNKHKITCCVQR